VPDIHYVTALVVGLVISQVALLATSVYLHRGLAHHGLSVRTPVAFVARVILWISTGMRAREWVAVHRRHHASSDTADDPHSPIVLGFWRVQIANAGLYRRAARDTITVEKYAPDLPPSKLDRLLFDRAWLGLAIGITIMCVTLGWPTGLLAAAIHMVSYLGLSGAVNAVGHTFGRRPNDNKATNGRVLALLTVGEGNHNNHHARPWSARFAARWSDPDLGWYLARTLSALRLAELRNLTREYDFQSSGATSAPPPAPLPEDSLR
jgi:stearoyl-CoA desaturase (Delta-9 desaturase)